MRSERVLFILKLISVVILTIFVLLFSYRNVQKLLSDQKGTQVTYRRGDDNLGNFTLYAMSLCPKHFYMYQIKDQEGKSVNSLIDHFLIQLKVIEIYDFNRFLLSFFFAE